VTAKARCANDPAIISGSRPRRQLSFPLPRPFSCPL
jgi:hypothetical protein